MESNINYILWLNRLQDILENTTDIKLFRIKDDKGEDAYQFTGDIQFKYQMISNTFFHSIYNVDDIRNIPFISFDESLKKSYKLVKKLQDALNSCSQGITTPKGYARIHYVDAKQGVLLDKNSKKRNKRVYFNWLSTINGNNVKLYNDDSLKFNYKEKPIWYDVLFPDKKWTSPNSLPAWINGGKDAQIKKRILEHSNVTLYYMYPQIFDLKNKGTNVANGRKGLQYITNMIRNVQYVDGVDVNREFADENTIYYYRNKNVIKNVIDNMVREINKPSMDSKSESFNKFVDYLFEEALGIFYCNLSHGIFTLKEFQKYGIEIIWYIICSIIGGSGAMQQNTDVDWIPGFTIEYMFSRVYTKVQDAKTNWSKALRKIKPTKITRCMYVKGTSKKGKDNWKQSKGIVRKVQDKNKRKVQDTSKRKVQDKSKRKVQDKTKRKVQDTSKRKQHTKSQDQQVKEVTLALEIDKLKQDGLSVRKIANQLNIGVSTVQRYLSKG